MKFFLKTLRQTEANQQMVIKSIHQKRNDGMERISFVGHPVAITPTNL